MYVDGKPIYNERQTPEKTYKYEVEPPHKVVVTPSIMRDFACVAGCTACCLPFTLDFTNDEFNSLEWTNGIEEEAIDRFRTRHIVVNDKVFPIQTYEQFRDDACPFLRPTRIRADGASALGCGFWTADNSTQPVECAAAPQLLMTTRGIGVTALMSKPFGRGWKWQNKPQCDFDPVIDRIAKIPDDYDLSDKINLLERYRHWAEYLEVDTWIPEILEVLSDFSARLRASNLQSVVVFER
jgi:hypothetical protein